MLPAAGLPIRLRPGLAGGDPRPAPLHGPGHPQDIEPGGQGFAGDREHGQPPRVAQARAARRGPSPRPGQQRRTGSYQQMRWRLGECCVPAAAGTCRPALRSNRSFCCSMFCLRLGPGRRFGAKAPRHQREAGRAGPRGQGPLPAPGGPVPGPDGGLGNNGGDRGHPFGSPRGPGPVQSGHKEQPPQQPVPAVITSHPVIVASAARACQAPGLPPPGRHRPAGGGRRRCSGPSTDDALCAGPAERLLALIVGTPPTPARPRPHRPRRHPGQS